MSEWSKDTAVDATNVDLELLKISSLHSKYLNIMSYHRHLARKMEGDYKLTKGIRESYYQGHMTEEELNERGWEQNPHILTNPQISRKLETDKILTNILLKKIAHEEIVSYCESVLKSLHNRSWDLKSYIDYLKYVKG
jgi:hypothetical protein